MSYQALARTWRPRRFEDLVGQQHIVRALTHALTEERLHHALLFSGTRGVGKTTLARIIAKCLNCERTDTSTARPCVGDDPCAACREIDEGRFVDLIEVDAASRTGVDDTRELMDNVHYAPARGRAKVYLIDEVHMLTKHSFNALLKTLEEPPPRVQFLFATTEPEKLPVTILSRCLHFPLKRLPVPEIAAQIHHILAAEDRSAEDEAVTEIARAADGSMRDGLSLLDQAIAFSGGTLAAADVRDLLGTIGQAQIQTLIEAIVATDAGAALEALEAAYTQGLDMRYLLETVASAWQDIATRQILGDAIGSDDPWAMLADTAAPGDVQLYYDIALAGLRDLAYAPDPLVGARMTVLRMLAFTPAGQGGATDTPAARAADMPAQSQGAPEKPGALGADTVSRNAPAGPDMANTPTTAGAQPADAPAGAADDWAGLVQGLALTGMAAQLAANGVCREIGDRVVTLELPRAHEHLATDSAQNKLQQALDDHWQPAQAPKLKLQFVDSVDDAPARRAERAADARQQAAVRSIENDPNVRHLQERLGAELRSDSIKPNESQ